MFIYVLKNILRAHEFHIECDFRSFQIFFVYFMLRWDDVVVTREERRDMFLNETHCATNRTFQICFSIATKKK
jgi:hypothetical protein